MRRASRASTRFGWIFACAVPFAAVAGCQALLGIDPDARQMADAAAGDGSFAGDASSVDASNASDAGDGQAARCDDCTPKYACEKTVCVAGQCQRTANEGAPCADGGTCNGYACIGPDTVLAAGTGATCIRASDGLVWCWGDDSDGLMGDRGAVDVRATPYLVPNIGDELTTATEVSIGGDHACAVLSDTARSIVCWGANDSGQTSGGGVKSKGASGPTKVSEVPGAIHVVAFGSSTCVLPVTDHAPWCWGDNAEGQTGLGSAAPLAVPTPGRVFDPNVALLAASGSDACTAGVNGLMCWGSNDEDLVLGNAADFVPFPYGLDNELTDAGAGSITSLAVSDRNVCVVFSPTGSVWCWGNDSYGQLGDGHHFAAWGKGSAADFDARNPVRVVMDDELTPLTGVTALVGSPGQHFCAFSSFTNPRCWGDNLDGELGTPFTVNESANDATGLSGALAIGLGATHSCILKKTTGFEIDCRGDESTGAVGNGVIGKSDALAFEKVVFPNADGGIDMLRKNELGDAVDAGATSGDD